ncbi:hypothetical protein NQZ68_009218 [Dissostichus eleginoides]|nr:hypothetical protein NQZ68_009218 [Dissostichus eleginoides]
MPFDVRRGLYRDAPPVWFFRSSVLRLGGGDVKRKETLPLSLTFRKYVTLEVFLILKQSDPSPSPISEALYASCQLLAHSDLTPVGQGLRKSSMDVDRRQRKSQRCLGLFRCR